MGQLGDFGIMFMLQLMGLLALASVTARRVGKFRFDYCSGVYDRDEKTFH